MKTLLAAIALVLFTSPASNASAALPDRIFPAKEGIEWRYQVAAVPVMDPYADPVAGTFEMRIMKVTRSAGAEHFEIREHDGLTGAYRFSEWSVSADSVRIRNIDFPGPLASAAEGFGFEFLKLPFTKGRKHDDGAWLTEVRGQEQVALPGKRSTQMAWRISVIGTRDQDYTAVGDYWIVPGWGIVKSRLNAGGWFLDTDAVERLDPAR